MSKNFSEQGELDKDMTLNRRKKPRIPVDNTRKQTLANLHINGGCYPCTILNISIGGLCLRLEKPLEASNDSPCQISLSNPALDQVNKHAICLRWTEQNKEWMLAGFEFSGSEIDAYESIQFLLGEPNMNADDLTGLKWL